MCQSSIGVVTYSLNRYFLTEINIYIFIFAASNPTARVKQCTSIVSQPYAYCSIGYNESVCLVCSLSIKEHGLTWEYVNSSRHLFRDGSAVYENETDKLAVNRCHPTNYSLEISPASIRYNKVFSCSQRKIVLTRFAVRREGKNKTFLI